MKWSGIMKSIKSLTVLALALAIVGLLVGGCGSDDSSEGGTQTSGSAEQEQVTVGVALPDLTAFGGVYGLVYEGMEKAAEQQGVEIELTTTTGEFSPQKYMNAVDDVVTRGPQVVTFTAYDKKIFGPVQKRLQDQGVKVVQIDGTPVGNEETAIVTDAEAAVRGGIDVLLDAMGGPGKVALLVVQGNDTVQQRIDFAKEALAEAGATVVEVPAGNDGICALVGGANATQDLLQAHPDVRGIFAGCGMPGVGAAKAVQQAGKRVPIISYDASPDELKAIQAGTLTGAIRQNFEEMGSKTIEAMVAVANGEPVDPLYRTGSVVVQRENVDEYLK
jgi:ribose transport system substrate-binding protein